mmetsp:Transcript_40727/g.103674  ORF Transcript_40727/g.103674 Transcript_40727/m.103674 type:complete len:438 (+) Transcript_40727:66-1379(+)
MRGESRPLLAAGAVACLIGASCQGFVQPAPSSSSSSHGAAAGGSGSSSSLRLRGAVGAQGPQGAIPNASSSGTALPSLGLCAVLGAAGAAAATAVARRAAAVKKKGVRVVDGKEIPWNLFAPKAPYQGWVSSNETITTKTPLVNWETSHVVLRHNKQVPYIEGQSIGIISPGPDKKGDTPAKVRLYSIASSACGDDETYNMVSLVVKRVLEVSGISWCEYSNVEKGKDPEFPEAEKVYRGVCSSHICDLKTGDEVLITGPTGAEMLLPDEPDANIIMLATGTGIAPFRSFVRKLFHDKATRIPRSRLAQLLHGKDKYRGLAWLFLGVPYSGSILYDKEWAEIKELYPDNFRYDYAVSDEMTNKEGKKMWVQHKVMEYADEIWPMLKEKKTHVYMCGLKGMESGFKEAFGPLAEKEGVEWTEFVKNMKKDNRYHVEVY